ncbi:MAG: hypothetical protein L0Y79_13410 [Chlorobi bacterium]|nr:hypothetical protein [Chlorobiota bacterium]MCI0715191.1 hypothetical protein [Chlorobiota bacterium]
MNKRLVIILSVVFLALLTDRFIFTTSGAKVKLEPEVLRASVNSELKIQVYASNLLGFKVPFREVNVRFVIEEGANLIEILNESANGTAVIRSKGLEGEAVVGIYSLNSGLQVSRVLIKILPFGMSRIQAQDAVSDKLDLAAFFPP